MKHKQKYQIDKKEISQSFNRAADSYDSAAFLQREVATRLFERLALIRLKPKSILDLGAGTGFTTRWLEEHYKKAKIIAVDFADQLLLKGKNEKRWFDRKRYVCSDAESLPFVDNSFDMVFSNLMLHWCQNTRKALQEVQRVLKPQGLLMFSTLGPDTLFELRETWAKVDSHVHVHSFDDMHDIGDILLQLKMLDPVMDMEFLTITYNDLKKILLDLKDIGAHNLLRQRLKGLTGKDKFKKFAMHYEKLRNAEGLLPVTYEVIYGHAFGAEKIPQEEKKEIRIPISAIKR